MHCVLVLLCIPLLFTMRRVRIFTYFINEIFLLHYIWNLQISIKTKAWYFCLYFGSFLIFLGSTICSIFILIVPTIDTCKMTI